MTGIQKCLYRVKPHVCLLCKYLQTVAYFVEISIPEFRIICFLGVVALHSWTFVLFQELWFFRLYSGTLNFVLIQEFLCVVLDRYICSS